METSDFDGAFKKKPPPRAARRRQVGADEDLDSSVRAVAATALEPPCSFRSHMHSLIPLGSLSQSGTDGSRSRRKKVWMGRRAAGGGGQAGGALTTAEVSKR
jgi:hypothetical protein